MERWAHLANDTGRQGRLSALALAALLVLGPLGITACSASPEPAPTGTAIGGGTASCDEASLSAVIREEVDQTYPGATFVSLADYECVDGWAFARAQVDTSGVVVPTAFFLRAEGPFWVPVSIEEICGTPLSDSEVPEPIYVQACGLPD